jgi:hypothetical protein
MLSKLMSRYWWVLPLEALLGIAFGWPKDRCWINGTQVSAESAGRSQLMRRSVAAHGGIRLLIVRADDDVPLQELCQYVGLP